MMGAHLYLFSPLTYRILGCISIISVDVWYLIAYYPKKPLHPRHKLLSVNEAAETAAMLHMKSMIALNLTSDGSLVSENLNPSPPSLVLSPPSSQPKKEA